ncbi:TRAP transporter small permease [Microbaculum marinum]|uniref:TRAP transporter small permease protein n=1 Tax=Microbaculum marinum TaxID=1764581 RepID=A0AAW9RLI7_9HYPH
MSMPTASDQMHEPGLSPELESRIGRIVGAVAAFLAVAGGLLLLFLVAMTVISITGRAFVGVFHFAPLNRLGPVPGDFEMVSAGCAVAVCAFLPWCQYRRGHVTVDVFITPLSGRWKAVLSLVGNVLMTVAAVLIAWRMQLGLADKLSYNETTMILEMPVWYGYAGAVVGLWVFALTSLYTVWRSINEIAAGREGP